MDPRSPLQDIHLESGIIGNRRQTSDSCSVSRLDNGVFNKTLSGFLHRRDIECRLRQHLHPQTGKQGLHLANFPNVIRGQNHSAYCFHAEPDRDRLCIPNNSSTPCLPSSSMACRSCMENAWPSAVPCISMNFPELSITIFISVQALASST